MKIKNLFKKENVIIFVCFLIVAISAVIIFAVVSDKNPNDVLSTTSVNVSTSTETIVQSHVLTTKYVPEFSQDSTKNTLTDTDALEIANELVSRYETYSNIGIACDLDFRESITQEESDAIWSLLSDERQMYLSRAGKCLCCKTYEQAKQHTLNCIDNALIDYITDNYVVYADNLYFFMGNKGGVTYQNVSLKEYNNERIIATAELYGSGGDYCGTYKFTISKGNDYRITNIAEDIKDIDYDNTYEKQQEENKKESLPSEQDAVMVISLEWDEQDTVLDISINSSSNSVNTATWKDNNLCYPDGTVIATKSQTHGKQVIRIFEQKETYDITIDDLNYGEHMTNYISGSKLVIKKGNEIIVDDISPYMHRAPTGYWYGSLTLNNGTIE